GKTVLNVPENAHVLAPAPVASADCLVAVVSSEGKLLAFPVGEVPEMPRGKGNKLYDIAAKKAAARTEVMTAVAVVPPKASLVLWSGETEKVIEWRDLQAYVGERAQRGMVLKRGWPRKIDRLETLLPPP
ncbi:MAG TPA: DNA topoisomerase IV subunit A, partial [Steroidobacteraceae bacterium]|nr:DNA topoisomerase IV subunit A [Steroidobacteraceae bacterium]